MDFVAPTLNYTCNVCSKSFMKKNTLVKHTLLCTASEKNTGPSLQDVTFKQLTEIVTAMNKRIITLEDRLSKTEEFMGKRNSICSWMDKNIKPTSEFDSWKKTFEVTDDHIQCVFDFGIIRGFQKIIKSKEDNKCDKIEVPPMFCFTKKNDSFWIHKGDGWKIASSKDLKSWLGDINGKIMKGLCQWKKNKKFKSSDDIDKYNSLISQLMDFDKLLTEIKKKTFEIMKEEMSVYVWD
jgi:hypothetical protein